VHDFIYPCPKSPKSRTWRNLPWRLWTLKESSMELKESKGIFHGVIGL